MARFHWHYRIYVKDYAKIVKPLNDLLVGHPTNRKVRNKSKEKAPWALGDEEQCAFDTILISSPILAYAIVYPTIHS